MNQFNYSNNFTPYNNIPFQVPRMSKPDAIFSQSRKLNIPTLLNRCEKGIDTINSIIPLYNKVSPLISNGKVIVNNLKKSIFKDTTKKVEKVDAEVVEDKVVNENTKPKDDEIIKEQNKPNSPFF